MSISVPYTLRIVVSKEADAVAVANRLNTDMGYITYLEQMEGKTTSPWKVVIQDKRFDRLESAYKLLKTQLKSVELFDPQTRTRADPFGKWYKLKD